MSKRNSSDLHVTLPVEVAAVAAQLIPDRERYTPDVLIRRLRGARERMRSERQAHAGLRGVCVAINTKK